MNNIFICGSQVGRSGSYLFEKGSFVLALHRSIKYTIISCDQPVGEKKRKRRCMENFSAKKKFSHAPHFSYPNRNLIAKEFK